jgi:succinyl-CoA synthetase beta subunit
MKLFEYQAKTLFERYGIPTVHSEVVEGADEAKWAARRLGGKVAVKAQVLVGGRGKAGGIRFAGSPEEARKAAQDILSMKIKSIPVTKVLIMKAVEIKKEYYMSLTLDRSLKRIVLIASAEGGVDIEELAAHSPSKIHLLQIDPQRGIEEKKLKDFLKDILEREVEKQALKGVTGMYRLFMEKDCSLVEINPLAHLSTGELVALDAKVIIDENALYRNKDLEDLKNREEYSEEELEAKQYGLSFVSLDGTIGCIVNGAGLAMATMDLIKLFGGVPANFLDVGGSSSPEKVIHAFDILRRNKNIRAVLINIFGGITRCDDIAQGILAANKKMNLGFPLVIRLIGTNEQEGRRLLQDAGISAFEDLVSAVKEVVKYSDPEGQ